LARASGLPGSKGQEAPSNSQDEFQLALDWSEAQASGGQMAIAELARSADIIKAQDFMLSWL
jgi:hypothetical protein